MLPNNAHKQKKDALHIFNLILVSIQSSFILFAKNREVGDFNSQNPLSVTKAICEYTSPMPMSLLVLYHAILLLNKKYDLAC